MFRIAPYRRLLPLMLALAAFIAPVQGFAQPLKPVQIRELAQSLPASRILFTETIYSAEGKALGVETGTLDLQYPCFRVTRGALKIYGDGTTIWNYDTAAGEVMVFGGDVDALFGGSQLSSDAANETFTLTLRDGSSIVYQIVQVETMETVWPGDSFQLDVNSLGDDVIVTDLRGK